MLYIRMLSSISTAATAAKKEAFMGFFGFVIILFDGVLRSNIHENDLKVFKLRNSSKGNGDRHRVPQNISWELPSPDLIVFISLTTY